MYMAESHVIYIMLRVIRNIDLFFCFRLFSGTVSRHKLTVKHDYIEVFFLKIQGSGGPILGKLCSPKACTELSSGYDYIPGQSEHPPGIIEGIEVFR